MSDADAPSKPLGSASPPRLVEHFFRHESGRLIAGLVRGFGAHRLELVEDAVQGALAAAVSTWPKDGVPDNPSAWLTRVAKNRVLDELRRARSRDESLSFDEGESASAPPESFATRYTEEIYDDELRMLYVCCDDELSSKMQLVLSLKLLCGFSTQEIAARLFVSDANVQKLLERGRDRLKGAYDPVERAFNAPESAAISQRTPAVLKVIYLLFNEGYSSMKPDQIIRTELCHEALRLGEILAKHPLSGCPEADALLALMLFHAARLKSRVDEAGELLLLEEQDRSQWDATLIRQGMHFLWKSGRGDSFSRYHAEAAVMVEHCIAPSFEETRWSEIVALYEALERLEPSPLHCLNRAIALSEWKGPEAGLALLNEMKPPSWLTGYYLWDATQGELSRRCGRFEEAELFLLRSLEAVPTESERRVFERKLKRCRERDRSR